jgi:hypothetical protein
MLKKITNWLHSAVVVHCWTTIRGILGGVGAACVVGFENGQFQLNWKSFLAFAIPTAWGLIEKDSGGLNIGAPKT